MGFKFVPGNKIEVPEIEYKVKIELPADKTALIIVDMQNDFVKEGGNLVVPAASETVSRIQNLLKKARNRDLKIAFTQDTQFKNDPEFEIWPEHCLINTWGWRIIDELKPADQELICQKNRYDGFYGTWLEHFLSRIWNIEHLVIVGTVSNICVLHTAAAAGLRWFHVIMPADGVSALTEFDQALTLRQVSTLYNGDVLKSIENIEFI